MYYYAIAPNRIVRADTDHFTYHHDQPLAAGTVVTIPVGSRVMSGVVLRTTRRPVYPTRPIDRVVEPTPLPAGLVATAQWMSRHYATHLATVWQTILPRGVARRRRSRPAPSPPTPPPNPASVQLTQQQTAALATIAAMTPGTALLHGVTGSGKTMVYLQAAAQAVAAGQSVIVVVPEIALTTQLVQAFAGQFEKVILTHSRQTEAARHQAWHQALHSQTPVVVIGPRSALFMPLAQVGLIVIDECHEPSLKQEQAPRYSALRVAATLASQYQAKLVLGSATPLVADYYLAQRSGRPIITMDQPARPITPPTVQVVDMRQRGQFGRHHFLSTALLTALQGRHQALIFHNRRGTAALTLCEQCGWQAGCPRCFVPLSLHADHYQLRCHTCGYQGTVPTTCPECGHANVIHRGIGTKQIEAELGRLFPDRTIARFDADTAAGDQLDQRYHHLVNGDIDIIIGTQVVAKGLDLPHLRTVGVIQADTGLALPDFAASERTFQLLAQVVGRVGRSAHPTQVVVQTYHPDHPAIVNGLTQDYSTFYNDTLRQRSASGFPPFVHLLKLVNSYRTEAAAIRQAQTLAAHLRQQAPEYVSILGPTPAFYERRRDHYHWQLIVKSPRRSDLLDLIALLPAGHWQYELDPISLL